MFLHFLTENEEKIFFLQFAYLLAVAEKEDRQENIPIPSYVDRPDKGEYRFEEFAPEFPMQTTELIMLRKFAEEMGITWDPISSYALRALISDYSDGSLKPDANTCNDEASKLWYDNLFKRIIRSLSVASRLILAGKELDDTSDRFAILKFVLDSVFEQADAAAFAVEKRKAILFEATAMAYADGSVSGYEQKLLVYFCECCHLDKELVEDFNDITKELTRLYSKSLEIITE